MRFTTACRAFERHHVHICAERELRLLEYVLVSGADNVWKRMPSWSGEGRRSVRWFGLSSACLRLGSGGHEPVKSFWLIPACAKSEGEARARASGSARSESGGGR